MIKMDKNQTQSKMRIAYIAAGAAGMYCGSCFHDNALAGGLMKMGHEVALVPTYTPLRTEETNNSIDKVFFNCISVYLEQKIPFFRNHDGFWDKLLDSKPVLKLLSNINASTNAKDLGELTVSMLRGEQGYQRKELFKMVDWLRDDYRPEIVQLTNSMLIGMARHLRKELKVPVLCALQGEDIFLDDLIEPYKSQAMSLLRERAHDVDGFVVTSHYYADYMAEYIGIPKDKIHTVHLGINLDGYGSGESSKQDPFTIGYLARICPEKGLSSPG